MGWPEVPDDVWHPVDDNILTIDFNIDGTVIMKFESQNYEDPGTYEVIDSTNTILMTLTAGIYTNPLEYKITSFDNDMLVRTFHVDEGFIGMQFERIE